jgi:hypothetical protein
MLEEPRFQIGERFAPVYFFTINNSKSEIGGFHTCLEDCDKLLAYVLSLATIYECLGLGGSEGL